MAFSMALTPLPALLITPRPHRDRYGDKAFSLALSRQVEEIFWIEMRLEGGSPKQQPIHIGALWPPFGGGHAVHRRNLSLSAFKNSFRRRRFAPHAPTPPPT